MRQRLAHLGWRLGVPVRAFVDWQAGIPDEGRVTVVGLVLTGVGFLFVWAPAAMIVPGLLLASVGLGFNLKMPVVSIAGIAAVAAVAVVALVAH